MKKEYNGMEQRCEQCSFIKQKRNFIAHVKCFLTNLNGNFAE